MVAFHVVQHGVVIVAELGRDFALAVGLVSGAAGDEREQEQGRGTSGRSVWALWKESSGLMLAQADSLRWHFGKPDVLDIHGFVADVGDEEFLFEHFTPPER